jgi:Trk K+ transport system NAD-binding subunit
MLRKLYNLKETHPKTFIVVLLILINFSITVLTAFIGWGFGEGQFTDPFDAFWKLSLEWLLDAGFYDYTETPILRALSVIFIITSLVTLNGGIVAFLSSFLSEFFRKIRAGLGKVKISHHTLILGWNDKGNEIVNNFLYDTKIKAIVVLSNQPREELVQIIHRGINVKRLKKTSIQIIVLLGDITSKNDLSRACYEDAEGIIVLNENKTKRKQLQDIDVLKTSLLLAFSPLKQANVIVEIANPNSEQLIFKFLEENNPNSIGKWVFINEKKLMGFMLFQALVLPGLTPIYHELLSFEGSDLNPIEVNSFSFDDYIATHSHAIPLFEMQYPHQKKHLLVLSNNLKDLLKNKKKTTLTRRLTLKPPIEKESKNIRVLIVGKNSKLDIIKESIQIFMNENDHLIDLTIHESFSEATIHEIRQNHFAHILFLASDSDLNMESPDSETLIAVTKSINFALAQNSKIIVEILDNKNLRVLEDIGVNFSLLSNRYVGRIISQASINPVYYHFIYDLITYDGNHDSSDKGTREFHSTEARYLFDFEGKQSISFARAIDFIDSVYYMNEKDPVNVLGFLTLEKGKMVPKFLCQYLQDPLTILPNDKLILIQK